MQCTLLCIIIHTYLNWELALVQGRCSISPSNTGPRINPQVTPAAYELSHPVLEESALDNNFQKKKNTTTYVNPSPIQNNLLLRTVTLTSKGDTNNPVSSATVHLYTPASLAIAFDRVTVLPDGIISKEGVPNPNPGLDKISGSKEPTRKICHCTWTRSSDGMQKKLTDPWNSRVVTFVTLPVRVTGRKR